ncbi:MAG: SPOR domain-containing protein [Candidatus Hydrogenedentes bacterium]|nr:SPOR domain-containing protein [Candidatus Hydrogenedentota bacterium]
MPKPRAYRTNKDIDADGPNWSYSQLVIGIAVTIVFAVTIFSIGYVVAIYDRPLNTNSQIANNNTQAQNGSPARPVPPASAPPSTVPSNKSTDSATNRITPPSTPKATVKRPNPTPNEITPLPAPGTTPTRKVKTPVTLPKQPSGNSPKITPPAEASTTTPTTEPTTGIKTTPDPGTTPTTKPAPPDTAPKATKPTAPSAIKGSWGIQVAWFNGKDRKKQAETFKQRMKSGINQDAIVVVSKDGKEYRVFIDGFPTKGEAKAACEKLKSKTGFSGAWVKRLP